MTVRVLVVSDVRLVQEGLRTVLAQQQGLVGPSLVAALKTIDKDEFKRTVFGGRLNKGMPDFSASKRMQDHWQDLYAYLKGRSDGKIQPGDLTAIDSK